MTKDIEFKSRVERTELPTSPDVEEILRGESKDTVRIYQLRQTDDGLEEVWVREDFRGSRSTIDHQFFRNANERQAWLESETTLLRAQGWHFPN
jgi:hypothetical protein